MEITNSCFVFVSRRKLKKYYQVFSIYYHKLRKLAMLLKRFVVRRDRITFRQGCYKVLYERKEEGMDEKRTTCHQEFY